MRCMTAADRFRQAAERKDIPAAAALMTPDAELHSPVAFKPFVGRETCEVVLGAIVEVLEDFRYVSQSASTDGRDHVLVFRARTGDKQVHGADFLRLDDDGAIERLDVMMRPMSALAAVAAAMGERLAALGVTKAPA